MLGVLLDITVDVAHAFLLEDLVHSDENTCLLDVAKTVVYCRAEEFHRG